MTEPMAGDRDVGPPRQERPDQEALSTLAQPHSGTQRTDDRQGEIGPEDVSRCPGPGSATR